MARVAGHPYMSLKELGRSPHPTMETAPFSIFRDPAVRGGSSLVLHYADVDGVVVCSRNMEAFRVAPMGEARVKTTAKVEDCSSIMKKCDFFSDTGYDNSLSQAAKYMPGFSLVDMVGGSPLMVIGVLNPRAEIEEVESLLAQPSKIREFFLLEVLNKSIMSLANGTRTFTNNTTHAIEATKILPPTMKIFPEDVSALSQLIRLSMRRLPASTPYKFTFVYLKYGQQMALNGPVTLQSTGLDLVVASCDKVEFACMHLALNFSAMDDNNALFWDLEKLRVCMTGENKSHFTFMGLTELGNFNCHFPRPWGLAQCIHSCWRDTNQVRITFAQAYTPSVNAVGRYMPFMLHPYLLSFLLGRQYVASKRELKAIHNSTANELDYRILTEAIAKQLSASKARFEVVATSRQLGALLDVDVARYAARVKDTKLLVEVPKEDMLSFSLKLVNELYAPLEASFNGSIRDSREVIPLILLCETVLSTLPSVSTKELPYGLLKSYGIAPLRSAQIARDRHITLHHCATVGVTGLLQVTTSHVNGVYLVPAALELVPRSARRELFQVMSFLAEVKANSHADIAAKAASILVEKFLQELAATRVIASRRVTINPRDLMRSGGTIHSVIAAQSYCYRAFDPVFAAAGGSFRGFLRVALDMIPESDLRARLATELLTQCTFVPRIVLHGASRNVAVTQFHILASTSFESIREQVETSIIGRKDCLPLLKGVQLLLMEHLGLTDTKSREITRFRPPLAHVTTRVVQRLRSASEKGCLGALTLAVAEWAKLSRLLPPSVSTRNLQRSFNLNRFISVTEVHDVLKEILP